MRVLVDLWENIDNVRISELQKVITWTKKYVGYALDTPRRRRDVILAHVDLPQTGFRRFNPTDVLLPARCALQQEINSRLAELTTVPRLAWTPDYQQRIVLAPPNLLGAMWLQFAQAVTGQFAVTKCTVCGQYFQVGPGGRRADSTTCGSKCRQRKGRDNKARSL
jgi:hypothetical protein